MGVRPWGRERLHKNMWWFNFSTICASFQNVTCCDELWGYKRRWRKCWGRQQMERKQGEAIEGEEGRQINMGFMPTINPPNLLTTGQ